MGSALRSGLNIIKSLIGPIHKQATFDDTLQQQKITVAEYVDAALHNKLQLKLKLKLESKAEVEMEGTKLLRVVLPLLLRINILIESSVVWPFNE